MILRNLKSVWVMMKEVRKLMKRMKNEGWRDWKGKNGWQVIIFNSNLRNDIFYVWFFKQNRNKAWLMMLMTKIVNFSTWPQRQWGKSRNVKPENQFPPIQNKTKRNCSKVRLRKCLYSYWWVNRNYSNFRFRFQNFTNCYWILNF